MQDEQFMRQWNAGHGQFSGDLNRTLGRVARRLRRHFALAQSIGKAYGERDETPLARKARLAGRAVIAGLATGMVLPMILFTVAAVPAPEKSDKVSSTCLEAPAFA